MATAIHYNYYGNEITTYFRNGIAQLPVRKKNGNIQLMSWGRRQEQAGNLPLGGWAKLDNIEAGKWEKYFPIAVKIPAMRFMEYDFEGNRHWFTLTPGQWLQGLIARYQQEQRLYIVTIEPEQEDTPFTRWPRIVALPNVQ